MAKHRENKTHDNFEAFITYQSRQTEKAPLLILLLSGALTRARQQ